MISKELKVLYFMVGFLILGLMGFGWYIVDQNEKAEKNMLYIQEQLVHQNTQIKDLKTDQENTKTELKVFKDSTGKLLSQAKATIEIVKNKGLSGEVGMAIFKEAINNGLEPSFVLGVIEAESTFRNLPPNECGATGYMQVTQSTGANAARRMGLSSYDLNDPLDNIKIGCFLMGNLVRSYSGDEHAALTAYNMGDGGLQSYIASTGTSRSDYSVTVMRYRNKYAMD